MEDGATYESVYDSNLEYIDSILANASLTFDQKKISIKKFCQNHDPDGYPLSRKGYKKRGDIICTVDGLISVSRMLKMEKLEVVAETYRKYRKVPIIFFPREVDGINPSRGKFLGDKIDLTLNDLKKYCKYRKDCKLQSAYELTATQSWLKSFNYSFPKIVDWMGIKGIFTDENYDVLDLERGDGTTLDLDGDYQSSWQWSEKYYQHIKSKIELFMKKSGVV